MSAVLPFLWASLSALGYGVFFDLRGRKLVAAALGGGVGWLAFLALSGGASDIPQYFAGAVAISAYAEAMARVQRAPVTVYLAPALIPLVPGGGIYETMLHALNGENALFLEVGIHTLIIAGALAFGVVTCSSIIRLLTSRQRRPGGR